MTLFGQNERSVHRSTAIFELHATDTHHQSRHRYPVNLDTAEAQLSKRVVSPGVTGLAILDDHNMLAPTCEVGDLPVLLDPEVRNEVREALQCVPLVFLINHACGEELFVDLQDRLSQGAVLSTKVRTPDNEFSEIGECHSEILTTLYLDEGPSSFSIQVSVPALLKSDRNSDRHTICMSESKLTFFLFVLVTVKLLNSLVVVRRSEEHTSELQSQ